MSPPAANAAEAGTIFRWESPRRRRISIFNFLIASLIFHAVCFYLFQITYPAASSLLPAPVRLNVITPSTEDGRQMLRWIEAEDPALATATQRPPDAKLYALPVVPHLPSYKTVQPALKEVPFAGPDLRVPSAHPPAPIPRPRESAAPARLHSQTTLSFSTELERFGTPALAPQKFAASGNEPPQTAVFRVGVDMRGAVAFCFLERSSGDRALDEQARRAIALTRFPNPPPGRAPNESNTWGTATIEWGNDLALPRAPSTTPPAP